MKNMWGKKPPAFLRTKNVCGGGGGTTKTKTTTKATQLHQDTNKSGGRTIILKSAW